MTDEVTGQTETEGTETEPVVVPQRDEQGRLKMSADFTFKVPEGHPEQGTKKPGSFTYLQCVNDAQGIATAKEKGWRIFELVNEELKGRARSNAYQKAVMPYRPSEVSPEQIRERMIKDLIRSHVPENLATEMIDKALALKVQAA